MTQRPSFWSRHASPHSDNPHQGNGSSSSAHATNTRASGRDLRQTQGHITRDHPHDASSSHESSPIMSADMPQPRLPPNSTSPLVHTSANTGPAPSSFSSSYSSSPSPSPSINPYAGSLRSMLQGTRSNQAPAPAPITTNPTGLTNTMPANIRRSGASDAAESVAAAATSTSGSGSAQVPPNTADHRRLQPQPQPQQRLPQTLKPVQPSGSSSSNRDARCEQIIQNFYSKVAQVVAHLRAYSPAHTNSSYRYDSTYTDATSAMLPPSRLMAASSGGQSGSPAAVDASSASSSLIDVGASGRRVNKWFNLDLEDIAEVKEEAKLWRHAAIGVHPSQAPPPPMIIEVCLDVSSLSLDDELQVADIYGRPWSVDLEMDPPESAPEYPMPRSSRVGRSKRQRALAIVLESWRLDLTAGEALTSAPDLPRVYKQAIVFFRGLYAFANLLPSVPLIRQLQDSGDGLALSCSFRVDSVPRAGVVGLHVSLTGTETFLEQHSFQPIVTPMGTFTLGVQYRRECLFSTSRPQRQQALSDYADIGAIDNAYFTPTLSSRSGSHLSPPRQQQRPSVRQQQQQQQQQAQSEDRVAASERSSVMMPSVNPFRARPLSLGDSSSLPNYIGDMAHRRLPSRLSSEWNQTSDLLAARTTTGHSLADRGPLRRISLGARVPEVDSVHGSHASDNLNPDSSSIRYSNSSSARAHSFDHRTGSTGARLSSSGDRATESGSMLHRSVMLRRFGDSLSPTEPQRQFDYSAGRGSSSSERNRFGPTSPPKPKISTTRQPSSASTGLGSGRWAMGIAPFKSPSLSDSQGQSLGSITGSAGEPPHSAGSRRGDTARLSPPDSLDASRRRGHTFSHDGAILGLAAHSEAQQLMAKLSESPSSLGSNASGHSRGLSSSFGNRRASFVQRQHSILGRPLAEHQGSDAASITGEGHMLPRRHTIVEGQAGSLRQTADDTESQDIDAFIRMVDTRRPLGSYSRKDSTKQVGAQRRSSALGIDALTTGTAKEKAAAAGRVSTKAPGGTGGESLRMYQGILSQFSTMSQDMQSSVVLSDKLLVSQVRHRPLPSMSEDAEVEDGVADELSSSPFRRMAMPNPLRGSDKPATSRPVSMVSASTPGAGLQASRGSLDSSSVAAAAVEHSQQQASITSALEDGHSLDKLQRAFGGLAIESRTESTQQQPHRSDTGLPTSAPGGAKPYIRSAAPGLDTKRERPLPQPVSIPRSASNAPRRTAAIQQLPPPAYIELEHPEDSDMYTDHGPNDARMRGKSQPLLHATELSLPATPRVATPQPPGRAQAQAPTLTRAQPTAGTYRPAPLALPLPASLTQRPIQPGLGGPSKRLSPELGPLSHRSDFISSNHQLGALLSMADNAAYARDSPRSTPATPMLGTLPTPQRGNNVIAEPFDSDRQSDRLRSNFPPLSFIVPRHRMDPYAPTPRSKEPTSGPQYTGIKRSEEDNTNHEEDDDEDLMFQM
ncbi:autophagy protein 13, partial [Coemansia sp. S2]